MLMSSLQILRAIVLKEFKSSKVGFEVEKQQNIFDVEEDQPFVSKKTANFKNFSEPNKSSILGSFGGIYQEGD